MYARTKYTAALQGMRLKHKHTQCDAHGRARRHTQTHRQTECQRKGRHRKAGRWFACPPLTELSARPQESLPISFLDHSRRRSVWSVVPTSRSERSHEEGGGQTKKREMKKTTFDDNARKRREMISSTLGYIRRRGTPGISFCQQYRCTRKPAACALGLV